MKRRWCHSTSRSSNREHKLPGIELLHNDDEVLDPADSTLRVRGSLIVGGRRCGSWEEHVDGHCVARIDGETISAPGRGELVKLIEDHMSGDGNPVC
jgi:hypothetical protein